MKINNNNLRAAKRHACGLYKGANGFSFKDFNLDQRLTDSVEDSFSLDEFHQGLDVTKNRTHDKSENAANDKESESTVASQ